MVKTATSLNGDTETVTEMTIFKTATNPNNTHSSSEAYIIERRLYHGLYGSTSCCISHGPSQWERAIFDPPQLGDPWTDFHET